MYSSVKQNGSSILLISCFPIIVQWGNPYFSLLVLHREGIKEKSKGILHSYYDLIPFFCEPPLSTFQNHINNFINQQFNTFWNLFKPLILNCFTLACNKARKLNLHPLGKPCSVQGSGRTINLHPIQQRDYRELLIWILMSILKTQVRKLLALLTHYSFQIQIKFAVSLFHSMYFPECEWEVMLWLI